MFRSWSGVSLEHLIIRLFDSRARVRPKGATGFSDSRARVRPEGFGASGTVGLLPRPGCCTRMLAHGGSCGAWIECDLGNNVGSFTMAWL